MLNGITGSVGLLSDALESLVNLAAAVVALDACAGLALVAGTAALAARWFAQARAESRACGLSRDLADQAVLGPLEQRCRLTLGDAEFAAVEAQANTQPFHTAWTEAVRWLAD